MRTFKVFPLILILIFVSDCARNHQLVPYEEKELWGYKNKNGTVVIPATYFVAIDFLETGIAAVADSTGWKYIDSRGNEIIRPYIFDNGPDYFAEDLARFTTSGKFGFFNRRGKIVIPAQWDFARPFSNGLAAVCAGCTLIRENEHNRVTGGTWGFIDKKGDIIIPLQYEFVCDFEGNQAEIKLNGEWKIIDKNSMFISN